MRRVKRVSLLVFAALATWIAVDLLRPRQTDFRQFDAALIGRLDGEMWRSYYERKPARLFWQLAHSLRAQFNAGFWSSFPMAYRAAKAAFTFKDGQSRDDYAKALPDLERYFASINELSLTPFDAKAAAQNELEWWIIRRERDKYTTADWERYIAAVAAEIYRLPQDRFAEYARLRVQAMVLRDERGNAITEQDWATIASLLQRSWGELATAVRSETKAALLPRVPLYGRNAVAIRRFRA
ncbi:MAG TPA: hypothetical protein VJ717_00430 [Gemmatimonadaceae bacterium]|nr:hypothetical protein [Gemmatimonadaceae bacterium]